MAEIHIWCFHLLTKEAKPVGYNMSELCGIFPNFDQHTTHLTSLTIFPLQWQYFKFYCREPPPPDQYWTDFGQIENISDSPSSGYFSGAENGLEWLLCSVWVCNARNISNNIWCLPREIRPIKYWVSDIKQMTRGPWEIYRLTREMEMFHWI